MNLNGLKSQVALGEDSRRQFKRDVTNVDRVMVKMVGFIVKRKCPAPEQLRENINTLST
ncbi:MAG: hypothetical protein IAE85_00885 [Anaerolinea sp.]|nr:hypothetical protein [Anaerolinea sp.]